MSLREEFDIYCSEMDDIDAEIANCSLRDEDNTICLKCELGWYKNKIEQLQLELKQKDEVIEQRDEIIRNIIESLNVIDENLTDNCVSNAQINIKMLIININKNKRRCQKN